MAHSFADDVYGLRRAFGRVPVAGENGERVVPLHVAVPGRARLHVTGLKGADALQRRLESQLRSSALIEHASASAVTGTVLVAFPRKREVVEIVAIVERFVLQYEAKASGRNQYRVYTSAVNARALKRLSLEMELRRAFENSQLEVYYQPKYETRSLQAVGGEALLRWFHPERGQIPTVDFVAVAEEIGLIGDIGRWVMQQVCRDLCQWRSQGLVLPRIAVNISGRDFMRPEALLRMSDAVDQARLSPSLFELELTEGVLMQDAEAGRRSLLALKEFGFALAVDDFGTGYCSLSYLKRFPLDTLKIDRSFVKDISTDADDAAIVRAIIALGHNLGLGIVAEGVSTSAQLEFLRAEGCDAVQGFLMSPAVPARTFADLLRPPPRAAIEPGRAAEPRRAVSLSAEA